MELTLGAIPRSGGRCTFAVWAPRARRVDVHLLRGDRTVALAAAGDGMFAAELDDVVDGDRYSFRLDGGPGRPDPASRLQPDGVHGPSQVVSTPQRDDAGWTGMALDQLVLYELHVGTFSAAGTFAGVVEHLDRLAALGVTAVELMPVAAFPGTRNWGYDGVAPFSAHAAYGGPAGLARLVEACHRRGLGVVLDVVYNHLGPEGNYLHDFGPYFTDRYRTPWGDAVNFDGPDSDRVRRFFIESAVFWVREMGIDGLRVDAVHAIVDTAPRTFVEELTESVHAEGRRLGRTVAVIAESAANDARTIRPPARGGWGFDAQWNDDFHHALHVLLTGERAGYYADYGSVAQLARAFENGFAYTGQYSAYRRRRHGVPTDGIPADRFVVFAQNHDQVGNRALGERLAALVPPEAVRLAAALVCLSPFVPLLFMGEEYGETAPFPYFVSHGDPALVDAVRRGRREEFASFGWAGSIPDPQAEATFASARLDHDAGQSSPRRELWQLHRELLRLRREVPALADLRRAAVEARADESRRLLTVRRRSRRGDVVMAAHLGPGGCRAELDLAPGPWRRLVDTGEERWLGGGAAVPEVVDAVAGELSVELGPWQLVVLHGQEA